MIVPLLFFFFRFSILSLSMFAFIRNGNPKLYDKMLDNFMRKWNMESAKCSRILNVYLDYSYDYDGIDMGWIFRNAD